jgi:hypothetical protein
MMLLPVTGCQVPGNTEYRFQVTRSRFQGTGLIGQLEAEFAFSLLLSTFCFHGFPWNLEPGTW